MIAEAITMSINEVEKLKIYERLDAGIIKQKHAATMLGVGPRQVRITLKKYKRDGPKALVSKKRGKKSNHAYSDQVKYSKETIRGWMIADGLWKPKKEKDKVVHQPRPRRGCLGELVQIDGSPHAWFEERGVYCCLITFIDDATSKILLARFFPAETTFAYMSMMQEYLEKYGKPAALYSDRHSVFRINAAEPKSGTGFTQFGRAMQDLKVKVLHANSAPAKGRVERSNQTQQDRFIKWIRVEGISEPDTANKNSDRYMETQHNAKFA